MAILAKADITISRIVDVKSVTTYYLLQSSTAAKPNKPTAIPPGGNWNTTEPTYESGSTSTLYTVILTIMSNDTYSYSDVSKSSSYEAAKEAWNKANRAQAAADAAAKVATNYIQGTDDGLIVGNMEADTLGANVKVGTDAMEIRNGNTVLARYAEKKVELGKNSADSVIELCGSTGRISAIDTSADGDPQAPTEFLKYLTFESTYMRHQGYAIELDASTAFANTPETEDQAAFATFFARSGIEADKRHG